jgi:hypothetical protein
VLFHVLIRQSGPEFESDKPLEDQSGWPEHAEFMDALVADGFILLGGPLGGGRVVHLVSADSEDEVRSRLARDPWAGSHLVVESVDSWTIRLNGLGVFEARQGG